MVRKLPRAALTNDENLITPEVLLLTHTCVAEDYLHFDHFLAPFKKQYTSHHFAGNDYIERKSNEKMMGFQVMVAHTKSGQVLISEMLRLSLQKAAQI
jgi:hypothetical protein